MRLLLSLVVLCALRTGNASPDAAQVAIRTFQFAPDTVRVSLGAKVVWTNQDEIEHTVTAGTPGEREVFSAVLKNRGATAERTFDRAGTFAYFCDRHQFMRGTITVTR